MASNVTLHLLFACPAERERERTTFSSERSRGRAPFSALLPPFVEKLHLKLFLFLRLSFSAPSAKDLLLTSECKSLESKSPKVQLLTALFDSPNNHRVAQSSASPLTSTSNSSTASGHLLFRRQQATCFIWPFHLIYKMACKTMLATGRREREIVWHAPGCSNRKVAHLR